MRWLRTLLSIVFAMVAIPALTAAACNFAIQSAIFSRTTYDAVLEDDVIFDDLISGFLPVLLDFVGTNTTFAADNDLQIRIADVVDVLGERPELSDEVTASLLPPDTIQATITQIVDVFFAVTGGNIEQIEQEIDLSELRERFTGDNALAIARLIVEEAPRCTPDQQARITGVFEGTADFLPVCNPGDGDIASEMVTVIQAWLVSLGEFLGDSNQVATGDLIGVGRDEARAVSIVVDVIFNQALILFYLCPFAFMAMIILVSVRSLNGFGRWIGGISTAVGVVILLTIFVLQIFALGAITNAITESTTVTEQFLARFGSALLRSAITASSTNLLLQAAIFIGAGFLLFGVSWYLSRDRDDEGSEIIITGDGQVISTTTQRRIGSIEQEVDEPSD